MKIRFIISDEIHEKVKNLAKNRYPGQDDAIDLIISDALQYKLDQWAERPISIMEFIWVQLAYRSPIPWLKAIAWGRLVEPYFK